jgi:hypothetical protein
MDVIVHHDVREELVSFAVEVTKYLSELIAFKHRQVILAGERRHVTKYTARSIRQCGRKRR